MSRMPIHALAWLFALSLSACGGGGGGGSSTQALTFTPAALTATAEPGERAQLRVRASPHFTASGTVYAMVLDSVGVIEPTIQLNYVSDGSYEAVLTMSGALAPGHYTGALEVRVCPVADCSQQFAGSPMQLPYDLHVGTPANLTSLSRIPGATDWETYQADAGHTGYAPITVDPASFSTRWRWVASEYNGTISSVAIANDTVYVVAKGDRNMLGGHHRLYALAEHDHSVRWSQDFNVFLANPPAVSGGAVFVATSGHDDTAMWSFDAVTGTKRFRTPFNSQWDAYYAPTVRAGKVYNDGGSYGGMVKVDAATGTLDWFGGLTQVDMWTPAVDDNFAYANLNGSLMALNLADGTSAFSVSVDPGYFSMYQSNTMPVVAGPGKIALRSRSNGANTLAMIDTVTRSIVWSASGQFVNDPVVANNVLYVANGLAIEARSVATGAVLWTWRVDTIGTIANLKYNLVVTNNLLFASTPDRTYAVDLSTHRAVWSYAKTGSKAISANGVLYIQTVNMYGDSDEALSAINLR